MIREIVNLETKSYRAIRLLRLSISLITFALTARLIEAIFLRDMKAVWDTLAPLAASASALLVSYSAERSILAAERQRLNDQRTESASVLNYLITVTTLFSQRINYLKIIISDETERPLLSLKSTVSEASSYYEKIYARENFLLLPGEIANAVIDLAGTMHGIGVLAAVTEARNSNGICPKMPAGTPALVELEKDQATVEKVIHTLYALRKKLDE